MYRKNNPWVALVAALLLALILIFACTGCNAVAAEAAEDTEPTEPTAAMEAAGLTGPRFEVDHEGYGWPWLDGIYVITDTQTGTQYLFCETGTGCGLCKLED